MKYFILSLVVLLTLSSCAHHDHNESSEYPKESNVQITENLEGHRWANIYFSSQPSLNDFENLKNAGFSTVINLRKKNEGSYNESLEEKSAVSANLNYFNIPFDMSNELTDEYLDKVTKAIVSNRKDGKVLVHCSSGNRVGVWLGAHFYKDHKFTKEESLSLSKELGLNNEGAINKLKMYFSKK